MLKYAISLLGIVLLLEGTHITSEAKPRDLFPSSLHLGYNLSKPLYYIWKEKTGSQYSLDASLDFRRILLAGTYGWGVVTRESPPSKLDALSRHEGSYFSLGVDYNFIKASPEANLAFLGMRYSVAYFYDQLAGKLQDESVILRKGKAEWDKAYRLVLERHKGRAKWLEIVTGVRVHIWWWVYAGCTAYYRFAKDIAIVDNHIPFDVIGWGLNEEEDTWGLHYYLSLRIPFQAHPYAIVET
jgi:hypothetical protein